MSESTMETIGHWLHAFTLIGMYWSGIEFGRCIEQRRQAKKNREAGE